MGRLTKTTKAVQPFGVVYDLAEVSAYEKKENPESPVGVERFYFLHPNLPAYHKDGRHYLVPELGEKCEKWRLAFQVGDHGWYHQVVYTVDPTEAHIIGPDGAEHRLPTLGTLDFFSILDDMVPPEPGTPPLGELAHLPASKDTPRSPKDVNAGFLLMVMELCGLVNPDVVVLDLEVPEGFEVAKIPIAVGRICLFVDRTLKHSFAGSDHPAFGGRAVLQDLVVANRPYLESIPRDRTVLIISGRKKRYEAAKKFRSAYVAYPQKRSPEKSSLVLHTVYNRFMDTPPFVVKSVTDTTRPTSRYSIRGPEGVWRALVEGQEVYLPDPVGYALNLLRDLVDEAGIEADFWSLLGAVRYLGLTVGDPGGSLRDYVVSLKGVYKPYEVEPEEPRAKGKGRGRPPKGGAPKGGAPKGGAPKGGAPRVFTRPVK